LTMSLSLRLNCRGPGRSRGPVRPLGAHHFRSPPSPPPHKDTFFETTSFQYLDRIRTFV